MDNLEVINRLNFIRCALLGGTKPYIEPNETNLEMFDKSIEAVELIEKIKDIITEEEHYSVSNGFENPHPNKADYDAVAADKFNRIWKTISEEMSN